VTHRADAVVVGAGFAGLYMTHRLRSAGLTVLCVEAGDGVGGTWYWNRYPGARCDVPSMDYSYSFSEELQQEWEWSERFAPQAEIQTYLNHVADRFDLLRDIRFSTRVKSVHYDEASNAWTLRAEDGFEVVSTYVVMATGNLSSAQMPALPGIDSFDGPVYHTGAWPEEPVDFTGLRVGVVGTGSSGVQAIPVIAEQAERVVVFQRTPNFSVPAHNRVLTEDEVRERKEHYSEHREAARWSQSGTPPFTLNSPPGKHVDPEVRERVWLEAWNDGNAVVLLRSFSDTMVDPDVNDALSAFVKKQIREVVHDPSTAEKLTAQTYPLGAKRLCLDTAYYEAFNRDNVELVDLRATPLVSVSPSGVETSESHRDVDVIVFATGFDAMTGALDAMSIVGRGGSTLRGEWAHGPKTYLGLGVAGFPNFFLVTGPGSPSVLSNVVVSIEQHVDWIGECIEYLRSQDVHSVEPTREAQEAWTEHVQETAEGTLFVRADSWYLGANVPGKPRLFMPYLGGVGPYREKCEKVAQNDYEGFVLS
jgi:cation diffusion facilitator CzcD-associated flavoprotein CzcO